MSGRPGWRRGQGELPGPLRASDAYCAGPVRSLFASLACRENNGRLPCPSAWSPGSVSGGSTSLGAPGPGTSDNLDGTSGDVGLLCAPSPGVMSGRWTERNDWPQPADGHHSDPRTFLTRTAYRKPASIQRCFLCKRQKVVSYRLTRTQGESLLQHKKSISSSRSDLSGRDLQGVDLAGLDLSGVNAA